MAINIGIASVIVLLSSLSTYFIGKYIRFRYLVNKFDGPPSFPLIGNTPQLKRDFADLYVQFTGMLEEYRHKHDGIMKLWLGPVPTLVIYGANHMETILNSTRHMKKGFVYRFLEPWLGTGLLTSGGQKWFHRRKLLTPTFHFSILQNFIEVFNEQSATLVKKLEKFADKAESVNIIPHITYCVLDVICATAMGKNINAQGDSENEYVKSVLRMSEMIAERAMRPWLWPGVIFNNIEMGRIQERSLKILHDVTDTMIQQRLREAKAAAHDDEGGDDAVVMVNDDAADGEHERGRRRQKKRKRIAFLDLLIQMHREDENFTVEAIREEVDTFMFEGHDTTAAAVSWAIEVIGLHPKVQARLHEELDQIFGDSDRPVTTDDLSKLTYLTCVVKETLRRVSSVPVVTRILEEDVILDGKTVPKGTELTLDFIALHRDPKYFPDPFTFDPDRFLPENSIDRHPFAFIPFSAGPRNCIGQKFAMMEVKVLLTTLLRKFSIESMKGIDETRPAGTLILRATEGIHIKLRARK